VNDVPSHPLFDSGATPNALNADFVAKHPEAFDIQPLSTPINVEAVNGQKLEIKGRTRIRVKLGGNDDRGRKVRRKLAYPAWAYVVSGLKHDVILGLDFLRLAHVVMDFRHGELRHGLNQIALSFDIHGG